MTLFKIVYDVLQQARMINILSFELDEFVDVMLEIDQ